METTKINNITALENNEVSIDENVANFIFTQTDQSRNNAVQGCGDQVSEEQTSSDNKEDSSYNELTISAVKSIREELRFAARSWEKHLPSNPLVRANDNSNIEHVSTVPYTPHNDGNTANQYVSYREISGTHEYLLDTLLISVRSVITDYLTIQQFNRVEELSQIVNYAKEIFTVANKTSKLIINVKWLQHDTHTKTVYVTDKDIAQRVSVHAQMDLIDEMLDGIIDGGSTESTADSLSVLIRQLVYIILEYTNKLDFMMSIHQTLCVYERSTDIKSGTHVINEIICNLSSIMNSINNIIGLLDNDK